jgi:hypothetical protein
MLFIMLVISFTILVSCNSNLEGITDTTERKLDEPIVKIIDGIPFAQKRAEEWRENLKLNYINAVFVGKESINNRKGQIIYYFYEENVKKNLDSSAEVYIDMNKNSLTKFSSQYGTGKELIGSSNFLDTKEWTVDIGEVFEIAEGEIGVDIIEKYDNPKVVLRCTEKFWEYALFFNSNAAHEDWLVIVNPKTGEVIRKVDKTKID